MSASILEHFSSLPDFRVDRHKLYPLPEGFGGMVLLLPSEELRAAVGQDRVVEPIAMTWQWFLARSPNGEPGL
jgi:hypothetical protein